MGRRQQRVRQQQAARAQERSDLQERLHTAQWIRMRDHPVETARIGSRPEHVYYRCMVCDEVQRVFDRSAGSYDFVAKHYHEGVQLRLPVTGVLA